MLNSISEENNNFHHCRNSYLEFDITVRNLAANFYEKLKED